MSPAPPSAPAPLTPLPIDPLLPELLTRLRESSCLVLEAPPGAGKTTRVPRALDDARLSAGEILVVEPRRLAARLAARRVAAERGEPVGQSVGYRVRFDEVAGASTRIVFVTEGILMRRLERDPELAGVGAVVLDEFHERHLATDVALALLKRLSGRRPELKLLAMSATLDADPVARFLGGCPILRAEGRRFEVAIEHASPQVGERPLEAEVARALGELVRDGLSGDVLVFLPGAAEIRRAATSCAALARAGDLEVVPLHGDLSPEAQDRAIRPGPRRKVILSTNVAESSLTVEGVVAVIDSGLHRAMTHSPWSGLPALRVRKISRASAAQRAGRAGRLRPGRCLRLYSRADHDARPAEETPEIRRSDLAETLLLLAASEIPDPAALDWLEPPPEPALAAARTLNSRLGLTDDTGALTPLGRRAVRFPLHPRLGRLLVEAEARNVTKEGCLLAAIAQEGGLTARGGGPRRAAESGPADLLADLDRFAEAERARFDPDRLRSFGLDVGATVTADRVRRLLERISGRPARRASETKPGARANPEPDPEIDRELGLCILAGYPDRVARRKRSGAREIIFSQGGTAELAESSVVRSAELLVAVDAEERSERGARGTTLVRSASAIEPEWLLELFPGEIRDRADYLLAPSGRVEVVKGLAYGGLVLDEVRRPAEPGPETARLLYAEARARGARSFEEPDAIDHALARLALLREVAPELALPELCEPALDEILRSLCEPATELAALSSAIVPALYARLDPKQRRALDEWAPERVTLPGGRAVRVSYNPGQPPSIASRLQDFFGMAEGPKIARGRVALTLHLLAPNQRAVQITSDLAGFWERHYPALRRELGRRYPRHAWPEDPLAARPPARR